MGIGEEDIRANNISSFFEKKLEKNSFFCVQSGITLVALVVTIVVLLILAGVSINLVLGNNGIISKSQNAADKYNETSQEEQNKLSSIDKFIEGYETEKGVIVTENNTIYIDQEGNTITIPIGFAVVKDADTIDNGLVISDKANDDMNNTAKGNQFVWVPVTEYSIFHLIEGYWKGSLDTMVRQASNPSREAGSVLNVTGKPGKPNVLNSTKGTTESVAMYESVKKYGGFYIARFESGINGTKDNGSLTTKTLTNGSVKPLSQKGAGVWNNICWGGSASDIASDGLAGNDNDDGAVKVARSMYVKSNNCGVTSTLCYGVQWDAVMSYIDSNYETGTCLSTSYLVNSTGKGNYTKQLSTTGYYSIKNIYDLAGNVAEWTQEVYNSSDRVDRGGSYDDDGFIFPATLRGNISPAGTGGNLGFRVTLIM